MDTPKYATERRVKVGTFEQRKEKISNGRRPKWSAAVPTKGMQKKLHMAPMVPKVLATSVAFAVASKQLGDACLAPAHRSTPSFIEITASSGKMRPDRMVPIFSNKVETQNAAHPFHTFAPKGPDMFRMDMGRMELEPFPRSSKGRPSSGSNGSALGAAASMTFRLRARSSDM